MTTFTIPSTGIYRNDDGLGRRYTAGAVVDLGEALDFNVPGAAARVAELDANAVASWQDDPAVTARPTVRATSDGQDYGVIPDGLSIVSVQASDSAYLVTLPDPRSVGARLTLAPCAIAYKLRSASPATVAINGGTGAAAKTSIPANTVVYCESARGQWYCHGKDANGGAVVIAPAS